MKKLFVLCCLSLFVVGITACDDDDENRIVFDAVEFQYNWDQWKKLDLQNYSHEYVSSGFCFSHLKMTYANGEVSTVVSLADPNYQLGDTLTIDGLFEEILEHYPNNGVIIAEKDQAVYVKEIQVEYHESYFFPTEVHYLLHINEAIEVDGNFDKYIRNFQLIETN